MPIELKAGLWFTICNFLQKGISFITIPIFTRMMSTDEYGIYSVYTSWYSLLTLFATLNLSYYVFNKGMVKYEDDRNGFELSMQSLSTVVTFAFFVIYVFFRSMVNSLLDLSTAMMLCMFMQILFEPSIAYWTSRNRFEYKYKAVVVVTLAISILNPLLGIVLIYFGNFDNNALARTVAVSVVAAIFGLLIYYKIAKQAKSVFNTKYWKYALTFNLPLIPHFLSQTILNQADRIMIKDMCSATDAAIYSVAYSIGMAVIIFSQAIQQSYLPWLYQKLAKKDYKGISKTANVFLLVMFGINLCIIAFAPEIISIVGSKTYQSAIWVMPPICGSVFFIFLQNLFANIEYYFEKTKLIAAASVLIAILNIILNAIFIKQYGFLAAGYTTLLCYVLYAIIHFLVMFYTCKKNELNVNNIFDVKAVFVISALFCGSVLAMTILYNYTISRYFFILIIVLVAVLFRKKLLAVFKELKNKE